MCFIFSNLLYVNDCRLEKYLCASSYDFISFINEISIFMTQCNILVNLYISAITVLINLADMFQNNSQMWHS